MKDLDIMTRMEKVEEQLEKLRNFEREQEQLTDGCKHNIIVVTSSNNCYSVEARCLFCGRRFKSNRALYDYEGIVDISEYYCIFWDTDKMILKVKEIYKDIVSQNENLTPKEISKMINEKFKEKYHKTKVIIEDIAKKAREC